eukprot:2582277-Rhodomonas_salina.1
MAAGSGWSTLPAGGVVVAASVQSEEDKKEEGEKGPHNSWAGVELPGMPQAADAQLSSNLSSNVTEHGQDLQPHALLPSTPLRGNGSHSNGVARREEEAKRDEGEEIERVDSSHSDKDGTSTPPLFSRCSTAPTQ